MFPGSAAFLDLSCALPGCLSRREEREKLTTYSIQAAIVYMDDSVIMFGPVCNGQHETVYGKAFIHRNNHKNMVKSSRQ